jgi:hypothetical protein
MRFSIFIGLLYVAYAINPEVFSALFGELIHIGFITVVGWWAFNGDIKELFNKNNK